MGQNQMDRIGTALQLIICVDEWRQTVATSSSTGWLDAMDRRGLTAEHNIFQTLTHIIATKLTIQVVAHEHRQSSGSQQAEHRLMERLSSVAEQQQRCESTR
jgi:hypothetical protein